MMEKFLEKIFKTPAVVLHKTMDASNGVLRKVTNQKPVKNARAYWKILGPGLTTGAADDDPSGIATYSQAGAQTGFQLLWLAGFTFPLMAVVQEMSARIGLMTGRGLAANIREHYPKWALYSCTALLFMANTFNIGADLGAMAQATQLVIPRAGFSFLVIGFAAFSLMMQIFTTYKQYARYLKWLTLTLLAYVFTAFTIHLDWKEVLHYSVIPSFAMSKEQIFLITAVLGTTISPYLFFWQASQEVEEKLSNAKTTEVSRSKSLNKEITHMRIDVWSGMFFSNAVMFFIIAVCGATLFAQGVTNISTAADAAAALRPLAGDGAFLLFAIGIIGTGLLAIPILAGSVSYAFAESFKWQSGLDRKLSEAYPFYGVIIVSMILGLLMQFIEINPMRALLYSAVANAIVAPVVLIFIVLISSSKAIMGNNANSTLATFAGWVVTGIMVVSGIATLISLAM
ncbi:MAG TPA: divalent metal cation transporter [Nitrospirales bacterium]|jgi:NRAMP (natural resistance-associated macrophage protein)-like metal ion transporter